ncbi:TetR/AcrR family transcriptional regulator [Parvibaculum sp.]|uniref:TetR/AcrR family transcriptional regulator n=1 Tax=Parvibaculum sp. TaxID=2024848 RepID=UPI0034A000C3
MPPRSKFTRAQLQAAALKIVDEQGLAALSMRTLAAALGTGPMTIYNYLRDREELDALLVEAVAAEIAMPETGQDDWRVDVRAVVGAMWQTVRAHPQVIPLILTRRVLHEATLAPAEALLQALARSGRSDADLLAAFRTLSGFVMGLAQARLAGPFSSDDAKPDPNVARAMQLPPARFPKMIEIAAAAEKAGSEREFQAGLDIIMAGLEAKPASPATAKRAGRH